MCNQDHNNSNNSSSNYRKHQCHKINFCNNLSNSHSKHYNNDHWPHNNNSNRLYEVKALSKGLVESLEEVWVVVLGKTLVKTLVPEWGPHLVEAEVKEVPP